MTIIKVIIDCVIFCKMTYLVEIPILEVSEEVCNIMLKPPNETITLEIMALTLNGQAQALVAKHPRVTSNNPQKDENIIS